MDYSGNWQVHTKCSNFQWRSHNQFGKNTSFDHFISIVLKVARLVLLGISVKNFHLPWLHLLPVHVEQNKGRRPHCDVIQGARGLGFERIITFEFSKLFQGSLHSWLTDFTNRNKSRLVAQDWNRSTMIPAMKDNFPVFFILYKHICKGHMHIFFPIFLRTSHMLINLFL